MIAFIQLRFTIVKDGDLLEDFIVKEVAILGRTIRHKAGKRKHYVLP